MKVTLVRKNSGKKYWPSCELCVFEKTCASNENLPKPFGAETCSDGEYWVIDGIQSDDAVCVLTDDGFYGIVVDTKQRELQLN